MVPCFERFSKFRSPTLLNFQAHSWAYFCLEYFSFNFPLQFEEWSSERELREIVVAHILSGRVANSLLSVNKLRNSIEKPNLSGASNGDMHANFCKVLWQYPRGRALAQDGNKPHHSHHTHIHPAWPSCQS
jgi:hypothetical protein